MYVTIRSRMSLIMDLIGAELSELYALEFAKIAAKIVVKMYVIIRYRMSLIMGLIRPELSELSALELENLPYLTLLTL